MSLRSKKALYLSLIAAFALGACAKPESAAVASETVKSAVGDSKAAPSALANILAGAHRSDVNRARDQYRNPEQTLGFFGVTASSKVIEITPGGGWYAEILAPWLKDQGSYTAAVNDPEKAGNDRAKEYFGKQNKDLVAKFEANPEIYGKPQIVGFDAKAANFGPANSADVVLTFRNAHNWMSQGAEKSMLKACFDVLKPGGVLGVTDHRASPGTDWTVSAKSGYVSEESVIKIALEAGFQLKAKSEINANPKDTKEYPSGVWTLPPSLALGETDREKYLEIGESDRMTLLFVKPE